MSTRDDDHLDQHGPIQAAISEAVVRIHRDALGRGPGNVRTTISGDVVTILMEDVFTRAEKSLIADDKAAQVMKIRHSLQMTMRPGIVAAVEQHTGRTVDAFMSTNHVAPDLSCEILVLDQAL